MPPRDAAIGVCAPLADDATGFQVLLQLEERFELEIARKDCSNLLGLLGNDDELAVGDGVAERHGAAHPKSLLL